MGTLCWGVKVWLVIEAGVILACSASARAQAMKSHALPAADDAPLLPCSLASPDENLRCEIKRGLPLSWVVHPPSSLREVYMRLMGQGRLPHNAILALDLKRAPFHPWAGKRSSPNPPAPSVFHMEEEEVPSSMLEENEEVQRDWITLLDAAATLPSLEEAEDASMFVPLLPSATGHMRNRRSTEEQPHTQEDNYRQESRRTMFNPWAGKRSGMESGRLKDVLQTWAIRGTNDMVWPAVAVNSRPALNARINVDTKRKGFSAWAGKRSDDSKRGEFSAWAGKRNNNDDKRQAFSAWAGKRSDNNDDKRQAFSAWAGKRSDNNDDKRQAFSAWAGKRSDNNDDKRQAFSAWAGKRNFNAWAGKRANDNKRQELSDWAEKQNKEKQDKLIPLESDGALPVSDGGGAQPAKWPSNSSLLYYFHPWLGKQSFQEQEGDNEERSRGELPSLLQQPHQQEHQQVSHLPNHRPDAITSWGPNWDS